MARATAAPKPGSAGFEGFGRDAVRFLDALAENNNRDWFTANRETYDREVLTPLSALISALAFAFQANGIDLTGDPKRSAFRIHRDARFSKNKSPYKTNASLVMSRDGSKQGVGIFYLQIGGGNGAYMAQGFYGPEPDDLAAFRHAIADDPKAWAKTEATLVANKLSLSREDTPVRLPKGFEQHAGTPVADALRLKSFVVRREIAQSHIFTPALVDDAVAFARDGEALLVFGRRAIDRGRAAVR